MSNPAVTAGFWSDIVNLDKQADALLDRVLRAVEPSQPTGREIPGYATIETRFDRLPITYGATISATSDALTANNVKRQVFTNHGSRVYIRELGFQSYYVQPTDPTGVAPSYDGRISNEVVRFPCNWRWNYQTSITQKWYANQRVLASAGGRAVAGNHLAFREPLVIEPMETFTFECELLSFGMSRATEQVGASVVIAMVLSGYREGM